MKCRHLAFAGLRLMMSLGLRFVSILILADVVGVEGLGVN